MSIVSGKKVIGLHRLCHLHTKQREVPAAEHKRIKERTEERINEKRVRDSKRRGTKKTDPQGGPGREGNERQIRKEKRKSKK